MHLTRPKSSKGRSRSAVNAPPRAGDAACIQGSRAFPQPAAPEGPETNFRSQTQAVMRPAGQRSPDCVPQTLRYTPPAAPPSLNKYKVLPSIERRPSEKVLEKGVSSLSLNHDVLQQRPKKPDLPDVIQISSSEVHKVVHPTPLDPGSEMSKDLFGSLLLAIRAPCGRRFQQRFEPTDTLLQVRSSAEVRYGASYKGAAIETVEVPRRSFTAMDLTLAQCGISNRSVLCISHRESEVDVSRSIAHPPAPPSSFCSPAVIIHPSNSSIHREEAEEEEGEGWREEEHK
ncbi:UBX domain-containing protein 10 [Antennarius striatus]|uniref:UBX domain-containing protein 10 n=1 Tax=Antennarius striatus TaxID=241820 RepID=UPI0035B0CEA3